jgi:prepilin-type N-terminal cleavage/methylation domain-containing protein
MTRPQGFTLIELAIVLVIVTILIGGLAVPLSAQIQARRIAETRADMQAIHDALMGYAMSHYITPPSCTCNYDASGVFQSGTSCTETRLCPLTSTANASFSPIRHYLPCPDAPNDGNPLTTNDDDGIEETRNASSGDCPLSRGGLPWATLGVKGQDAWGNRYTYAVTPAFANDKVGFTSMPDAATPPTSPTPGNLNVYSDSTCGTALVSDLPVIVVSHGANGRGAQNANGGTPLAPASVAADERQNLAVGSLPCASPQKFVSHNPTEDFDDLVTWLSRNELFNRVCPSGGCP